MKRNKTLYFEVYLNKSIIIIIIKIFILWKMHSFLSFLFCGIVIAANLVLIIRSCFYFVTPSYAAGIQHVVLISFQFTTSVKSLNRIFHTICYCNIKVCLFWKKICELLIGELNTQDGCNKVIGFVKIHLKDHRKFYWAEGNLKSTTKNGCWEGVISTSSQEE